MEKNASAEVYSTEETPVEAPREEIVQRPKRRRLVFISLAILIVVAGLISVYLVRLRQNSQQTPQTANVNTSDWRDYTNPNGFKVSYPNSLEIEENEKGIVFAGEASMAFVISKRNNQPLAKIVNSIATNFDINNESAIETHTLDSRVGFVLNYNGSRYYYFPLIDDYYLEIVDNNESSALDQEILQKVKFTPPLARLN